MLSTDLMLATILTWSFSEATIYKEVLINATTNFSCSPNEDIPIQWHHTAPGKSESSYLYAGGRFLNDLSKRGFRLEKDSNTGPYHLVIPHATYEDAGLYECKEDIGSRMFGSTQLTVLKSNPVCESNMKPDGYVGNTTCNLEQENMIFTCAVSFSGKPPQMAWKILNGWQPFSDSMCKPENGRINCSLTIRADSIYDGSFFNCQSTKSTAECSTEIIKVQYFEDQMPGEGLVVKNVGEKVNCSVKSNQVLDFEWIFIQWDQRVNVTNEQELSIQKLGLYQCYVEYSIRNVSCTARPTEVNVQNPNTTPSTTSNAGKAAISAQSGHVVTSIVVIIALVVHSRPNIF